MVNVTTSETNGKTYSNVAGLTPMPAALKNSKPAPVHESLLFTLDAPDMKVFNAFHEKLQDAIKKSPEWAQHARANAGGSGFDTMADSDVDSEIPF